MPTVLGDVVKNREEARRLLGNPLLSKVSDELIDSELEKACSSISTDTGRNWSSSDKQWYDVVYTQNMSRILHNAILSF